MSLLMRRIELCSTTPGIPTVSMSIVDAMNANTMGRGFVRVGKKKAGRILDGQTHDELPWLKPTKDEAIRIWNEEG